VDGVVSLAGLTAFSPMIWVYCDAVRNHNKIPENAEEALAEQLGDFASVLHWRRAAGLAL